MDNHELMHQEIHQAERLIEDSQYEYRQEQKRLEQEYDLLYEKERLLVDLVESRCEVAIRYLDKNHVEELKENIHRQKQSWLEKIDDTRRRTAMQIDDELEELELQYRRKQQYLQDEIESIYRKYESGGGASAY